MRLQRHGLFLPIGAAFAAVLATVSAGAADEIRYNRDIRPILSENCFACHGPDAPARKADLRLDTKDGLLAKVDDTQAVVPGDPARSAILARITSADADEVMPPPKTGKKLTPQQVDLLKRWVEQGAKWEGHWAYTAPARPAMPPVKRPEWVRNPIDAFIRARLEAEGLKPSTEADKPTLIRRLTLDLTGLPPTPAEVDAFVGDNSPDAYEKVVDRLLASPRYGERMALDWLDAARYADTHGYHIDSGRDMWLWRDWVINAFNANVPFDRFTIEQLAGDMLPDATVQQKIASGFNRNHMINYEGGAIPEEYHAAYLVDRVNTTGAVWMGLTVQCSQCHDHKYDPLTQKEYFQLYAYFNNVPENGLDGKKGNAVPFLKVPTPEQQAQLDALAASIQEVEKKISGPMPEFDAAQAEWEKVAAGEQKAAWSALDPTEMVSAGKATLTKRDDLSVVASGTNPQNETYTVVARTDLKGITAIRVEALPDEAMVAKGPGRSDNGNAVLTDVRLGVSTPAAPADRKVVKFKSASATFSQPNFPASNAIDDQPQSGWAIFPEVGKPHAAVFELAEPIHLDGGTVLTVALDFQSIYGRHQFGRFRVSVTTSPQPHLAGKLPEAIAKILATPAEQRTDMQKAELRTYFRSTVRLRKLSAGSNRQCRSGTCL
jgi:mono/diheme cytochrome c family protein